MDLIYKCFTSRLEDHIIHNMIRNRNLTFKNAEKSISVSNKNTDVYDIIFRMIKSGNDFLYEHELHDIGICCINPIHKEPLAQKFYHEILVRNELKIYCNNCVDVMIRFSKTVIHQLGKTYYNKLRKIFLLIRKSSIYYSLDVDCFNIIFNYYSYVVKIIK